MSIFIGLAEGISEPSSLGSVSVDFDFLSNIKIDDTSVSNNFLLQSNEFFFMVRSPIPGAVLFPRSLIFSHLADSEKFHLSNVFITPIKD